MKKILAILFLIFLFNSNVEAASICSYKEQTSLNQVAANVKVSYEIIDKTETYDDMYLVDKSFNISILNITEDLYVVIKNNINEEEKVFYYEDTKDGIVTFKWDYYESVTNFTIEVYSSDKTSCPEEKYKTLYLTTPRYNEYSERQICQDLEDFYLCQEFVTFADVDIDKFYSQLEKYQDGEVDDSGDKVDDTEKPTTPTDRIFDFLKEYKWYIIGGSLIIVLIIVFIHRARTKKQRELGL